MILSDRVLIGLGARGTIDNQESVLHHGEVDWFRVTSTIKLGD